LTPAAALAERLAEEMATAWRRGETPAAEEFLARHSELCEDDEAVLRLIYEEICLREDVGHPFTSTEVVNRFPSRRAEILDFLDCHRLLRPHSTSPAFPEVGDRLGDFHLLAELDRGALGRVFLATQPALADRPVVLKLTPCVGGEHLTLARLQHTYIVPLYWVQDFPERNLRVLCMPYLGGTTLARLLTLLHARPAGRRCGKDLVNLLDEAQASAPLPWPANGPARQFLTQASYVQAVCWIGACLADALHYAHERGLVHLDLKPANVLLAADGQPMLLDFHLAREPVRPGEAAPERLGGTPGYMSPEQQAALGAVRTGQPVAVAVDSRSDLYSLGLLLYEALGGAAPAGGPSPPRLSGCNPQVSVGLADVLHKCLSPDPHDRYADAATLAADLRRHRGNLPLRGVVNRSLTERWRKWRRRRPHALALLAMCFVVVFTVLLAGAGTVADMSRRFRAAKNALADGREQLGKHEYTQAVHTLTRGLAEARSLPASDALAGALERWLCVARRAESAQKLHEVADRLRFVYGMEGLSADEMRALEKTCRAVWDARGRLAARAETPLEHGLEQRIQTDLIDLVILWADLGARLAPAAGAPAARKKALRVLTEAEALFGTSIVLCRERQSHAEALGQTDTANAAARRASELVPRTAWEHYALGRYHFRTGDLILAVGEFERALELRPQELWPNYYRGLCAYRLGRYEDAARAFHACVALAPTCADCFYNRALAHEALGQAAPALRDYDRALQLAPHLAAAALNRGMLHYREGRHPEAVADLHRALDKGADPALVHYNLALVQLAREDRSAAETSLRSVLQQNVEHPLARELLHYLQYESHPNPLVR
jgi:serine/threonine protein kinase/tetratricopeptide (TPR) repeat protein